MKKFTIVSAIVMLFAGSAFATGPGEVSSKVKAAFETNFSQASQVRWEKASDFYFASFTLNNVEVDVAYNEAGELVGTSRRITAKEMPLSISLAIAEKYSGYKADESITELTFEGVTRYYVTVSDDKQSLKLKCYSNGDVEITDRWKK